MMTRRLQQFLSMLILAALAAGCSKEETQVARFEIHTPATTTVTPNSVTLTCTVSGEGRISDFGQAGIAWGVKGSPSSAWQRSYNVTVTGNRITGTAAGLNPETDYSAYCFIELESGREVRSKDVGFTTPASGQEVNPPAFTFRLQTSNITASGATLHATVGYTGSATITEMGFCYAQDNAQAQQGYEQNLSYTTVKVDASAGEKQIVLSDLAGGGYIWYLYAMADGKRFSSAYARFSTADGEVELPEFVNLKSSNLTSNSVTLECDVEYDGREALSSIEFRLTPEGGAMLSKSVSAGVGHRTATFTDLAADTRYTWYVAAAVKGREARSSSVSFTTQAGSTPSGKVHRTGWYELPEEQSGTQLYFAYHMRPDAPAIRNYSVCYSAELHCAIWAAAAMHSSWDGSAGRNDSWQADPEIPSNVQPNLSSSYTGNYSRGHMVASSDRQVSAATNRQTFYYTNMAPQIQNEFNGGIWNKLEILVQDTWTCSDTLYVVTGAHFANRSKTTKDKNGNTCYVPTHFYKVMLRSKAGNTRKAVSQLSADQLQCVGFWFDHFGYGTKDQPSSQQMRSVADIEKETGLSFFPNVPNAPKTTYKASDWGM